MGLVNNWNLWDLKKLIICGYLSISPSVDICFSLTIVLNLSVFSLSIDQEKNHVEVVLGPQPSQIQEEEYGSQAL